LHRLAAFDGHGRFDDPWLKRRRGGDPKAEWPTTEARGSPPLKPGLGRIQTARSTSQKATSKVSSRHSRTARTAHLVATRTATRLRPDFLTGTTAVIDPRWQYRRHLDEPGAEHSDALSAYRAEQQRTIFWKATMGRFPRSFVDRPEQQAICPRLPTRHPGSRRRTLLAILKPSPPSEEFQPRASCSNNYSDECSALRSISDSTIPDHWG
jgi:hypothetical protein